MDELQINQRRLGFKGLVFFLILNNMFIPLSIDMYLPALPAMSNYFGTSPAVTNLTLTAFFFFYGCGLLIWGPLSDKYGRRRCLILGAAAYLLAGIGCALANNINHLIFCRILQGLAAGAIVTVSLAIVKESFDGRLRETILVIISTLSATAPVIAPLIGAVILWFADFKLVFWILSGFGMASLLLALLFQETLASEKRYSGSLFKTMSQIFLVLKNRSFLWPALIFSLNNLPIMGYIAIASYVYEVHFGLSEQMFSVYFAANSCAFVLGPILYYRFFRATNKADLIRGCFLLNILFGIAIIFFGSSTPWAFWLSFIPYALINAGIRPMATNLMLEQQQDSTGTTASLIYFSNTVLGSLGTLIASIAWGNIILSFGVILTIFSLLPLGGWLLFLRSPVPCIGIKEEG
ncbi:MAG: multidrug effflux MFS transporter [Firmicutes bacterium]|nr:multidrug effflux MFS transporter [Bacillota bacterium]